jgi:hypothetical protein
VSEPEGRGAAGAGGGEDPFSDLADELERLVQLGAPVSYADLAERFGVKEDDVASCHAAVQELLKALQLPRYEGVPARLGDYEVEEELSRGGMGVVYRAWHPNLQREVAIKVLLPGSELKPARLERFRREARAAARLRHPNIVAVHDVGEEGRTAYLVMDLIQGASLADLVHREGPLPPLRAAEVVREVAGAVAHAHAHEILHRDVKPANVLLTPEGEVLLTDFGIAKLQEADQPGLTKSHQALGTPHFMSPEQLVGGEVGRQTDVYSLGATLYALLVGDPPFFDLGGGALLGAMCSGPPRAPSEVRDDVDPDLEAICLKCLEGDADRRYPDASALVEELTRYLQGDPVEARPLGAVERLGRFLRRQGPLAAALGVAVVLLLGGGAVAQRALGERPPRPASPPAEGPDEGPSSLPVEPEPPPPQPTPGDAIFSASYARGLESEDGLAPSDAYGVEVVGGVLRYGPEGRLTYSVPDIDPREGSVSLWVRSNWAGETAGEHPSHGLFSFQPRAFHDEIRLYVWQRRSLGLRTFTTSGGGRRVKHATTYLKAWRSGTWRHVVATWSASARSLRLYVDGTLAAGEEGFEPPAAARGAAPAYVGFVPAAAGGWDGELDQVRIFREALGPAEVLVHYQAGR